MPNLAPAQLAARLRRRLPCEPRLAFVLGSGFDAAVPPLSERVVFPYSALPGFPRAAVAGHAGQLEAGFWRGVPTVILRGRTHFYEGHDLAAVTWPVRMLAEIGVRTLVLTNAAGGINRRLRPGDLMLLTDHINFMGANPLRGPTPAGRERFVDLSEVYDAHLRTLFLRAARRTKVQLRQGVYLAVSGPSYETPAEIRAFARLGADAVGMSTVPEAIAARQCGLAVAGLSCITNLAAGRSREALSHREVLALAHDTQPRTARLLDAFVELFAKSGQTPR